MGAVAGPSKAVPLWSSPSVAWPPKSLAEGKPEKIVPKIVEGRLNAFYKENVLLEQSVKDPSKTVRRLFEVGGAALAFARVEGRQGRNR